MLKKATAPPAHGCTVPITVAQTSPALSPQWRLTNRGIGLIIAIGLLLSVAAMVCIGMRAAEVTSDGYIPANSSVQQR